MEKEIPIEDVEVVKYCGVEYEVLAVVGKLIAIENWNEEPNSGILWLKQDDVEYPVEIKGVQEFV
ncbi:hypothetical protein [Liquorilactobacillus hordei]|uniref:hypothetical protein n=1 Tax=Liquorilactobacillus hordei TaxID=468911 RepID=UPI0039EB0A92